MRMNRLPRRLLTAIAAGLLLTAAPAAQADPAPPAGSPAPQAAGAHGLRAFQQSYGLPATGRVDITTAHLLKTAPEGELRTFFAAPSDLGREQLANARTVIGVGKGAELSEEAQVIALMTAMQESTFVNYTSPVDNDSLGVFQQRPSMGWGTPAQITHVPTASKSFYGLPSPSANPGLLQIDGWESMEPGAACQAVQRSAHPGRYAQWEDFAKELLEQEGPDADPIP
ncbi:MULTISPECIES: peptidoglycan-binding protein [Streptomyces]|uniref:Peptidoglycan-binding protein n=2 Tax=Streptomyces TaxID=1883 RepID=A0A927BL95_STRGL|nr:MULTISPECIES: peptidoglycan-binding protein [Streptomyces]MBD2829784.1 peptidoglycan-binding protein [Streptomyces globisporus]MYW76763.1 peptidoglycan-binding protein [Streptomyces sp. SID8369]NEC45245.1 peptidoglycan-binding protein [Streptomyces sp. SID8016]KOU05665.1 peptidoglycan-binding protein [Streptomyces sp. NRRL F-2295]MBD3548848.1 peptidoglycan-binding protein [Streptomyces sp. JV180]